jgi:hypothetical protein
VFVSAGTCLPSRCLAITLVFLTYIPAATKQWPFLWLHSYCFEHICHSIIIMSFFVLC